VLAIFIARLIVPVDAILQMGREHQQSELIKSRPQRRYLGENVDTVALLIYHFLNSGNLTGDSSQPLLGIQTDAFVHKLPPVYRFLKLPLIHSIRFDTELSR